MGQERSARSSGQSQGAAARAILALMKAVRLLVLITLTALVFGCGQKGPLVMPDAQHPRKKAKFPAPPKTAPAPAPTAAPPATAPPATAPAAPAPAVPAPGTDAAPTPPPPSAPPPPPPPPPRPRPSRTCSGDRRGPHGSADRHRAEPSAAIVAASRLHECAKTAS